MVKNNPNADGRCRRGGWHRAVLKIGVLDIQGSVEEHFDALRRLGDSETGRCGGGGLSGGGGHSGSGGHSGGGVLVEPVLVKKAADFAELDGLILPGGESTTISKLIRLYGLDLPIAALAKRGGIIFGTCAGAILLARESNDPRVKPLGLIDIDIDRNAYGRQLDSFESEIKVRYTPDGKDVVVPAVFIRAPIISRVGKTCEVLAKVNEEPVFVRQGNVFVATFHPEMTDDLRVYEVVFGGCQKRPDNS